MQSKAVLLAVLASLAAAAPGHPPRRGAAEHAVRPRDPAYPVAPPPPAHGYPVDPYPMRPASTEAAPSASQPPQGEEAYPAVTRTTTKANLPTTTPTTTTPHATPSSTTTTTTTPYRTTTIPEGYPQGLPSTQPFSILPLPQGYPQSHPPPPPPPTTTTMKTTPGYSLRPTQSAGPPPPTDGDGGKDKNKACGASLPMCCETTLLDLAGVTCKPSSNKKQSAEDLQKECASVGLTAKCCTATLLSLPVGVVCTDPLKDSK